MEKVLWGRKPKRVKRVWVPKDESLKPLIRKTNIEALRIYKIKL